MSQAGIASISKSGGGGLIQTINGDTGSITGSTVTIYTAANINLSGATVGFFNSGTTSLFQLTDGSNMFIGNAAGTVNFQGANGVDNMSFGSQTLSSLFLTLGTANGNSAFGAEALQNLNTGNNNTSLGYHCLQNLKTGNYNLGIGQVAGFNYSTSESSNIIICNSGIALDSNVIRIGTQGSGAGQQNTCYIAGIVGVTNSNAQLVTVNSSTGQLGVSTGGSIISTWTDVTSSTQTLATGNGYATDNAGGVTYTLPSTANLGDEIRILGKSGVATITPGTGQQIVMSTVSGTVGATGTAVGQNSGASCILQCITPGVSTVWRLLATSDNWTLT